MIELDTVRAAAFAHVEKRGLVVEVHPREVVVVLPGDPENFAVFAVIEGQLVGRAGGLAAVICDRPC